MDAVILKGPCTHKVSNGDHSIDCETKLVRFTRSTETYTFLTT